MAGCWARGTCRGSGRRVRGGLAPAEHDVLGPLEGEVQVAVARRRGEPAVGEQPRPPGRGRASWGAVAATTPRPRRGRPRPATRSASRPVDRGVDAASRAGGRSRRPSGEPASRRPRGRASRRRRTRSPPWSSRTSERPASAASRSRSDGGPAALGRSRARRVVRVRTAPTGRDAADEVEVQLAGEVARTPRRPGRCCRARRAGGDHTPIPSWPGRTARIPPDTPLFAGRPTSNSHSPAPSYMPQVAMTDSTSRTVSSPAACSPGERVAAARGERRGDQRQVAGVHRDAQHAEVGVEHGLGVVVEGARAAQQVGDRAVAVAGRRAPSGTRPRRPRGRRPANRPSDASRWSIAAGRRPGRPRPGTMPTAVIAPALTIGLSGMPVAGASEIALKASPVGSTPIRRRTARLAVERRGSWRT